jgi:hypothetical protein
VHLQRLQMRLPGQLPLLLLLLLLRRLQRHLLAGLVCAGSEESCSVIAAAAAEVWRWSCCRQQWHQQGCLQDPRWAAPG